MTIPPLGSLTPSFMPKQKHNGYTPPPDFAINYKYIDGVRMPVVVKYEYQLHRFNFKWPIATSQYTKASGVSLDPVVIDKSVDPEGAMTSVTGVFCYPTTFLFKQRYQVLKDRGYHCGGIDIKKECAIMYYKKEDEGNSPIRMVLKFSGDFVFWVAKDHGFAKPEDKEQLLDSLLNVVQMFQ